MLLAIIVLAYNQPQQLARLLTALRHPQIRLYLHVDRRAALAPFAAALSDAGVRDDIHVLRRHASVRGSAECVDAVLEGLRAASADGCEYFLLVSGQDFPLRHPDEIVAFAERAGTTSYIQYWPIDESRHQFPRGGIEFYAYTVRGRREVCIPRGEDTSSLGFKGRVLNEGLRLRSILKPRERRFPSYAQPFVGATWWNISRSAAEYVLTFCDEHPDYRRYHQYTCPPDEIFFQSILAGTDYAQMYELVSDSLRFYRWDDTHAKTLISDDLAEILASDKLFARKLDMSIDNSVLDQLAQAIDR